MGFTLNLHALRYSANARTLSLPVGIHIRSSSHSPLFQLHHILSFLPSRTIPCIGLLEGSRCPCGRWMVSLKCLTRSMTCRCALIK
jgi:hypothetical protein